MVFKTKKTRIVLTWISACKYLPAKQSWLFTKKTHKNWKAVIQIQKIVWNSQDIWKQFFAYMLFNIYQPLSDQVPSMDVNLLISTGFPLDTNFGNPDHEFFAFSWWIIKPENPCGVLLFCGVCTAKICCMKGIFLPTVFYPAKFCRIETNFSNSVLQDILF